MAFYPRSRFPFRRARQHRFVVVKKLFLTMGTMFEPGTIIEPGTFQEFRLLRWYQRGFIALTDCEWGRRQLLVAGVITESSESNNVETDASESQEADVEPNNTETGADEEKSSFTPKDLVVTPETISSKRSRGRPRKNQE